MTREEFKKDFADVLYTIMVQRELSVEDVRDMTGLRMSQINDYLNQETIPSPAMLQRVCSDLGINFIDTNRLLRNRKTLNPRHKTFDRREYENMFINAVNDGLRYYDMSLKELSMKVDISYDRLQRYMNHMSTPGVAAIRRIGEVLEFEDSDLEQLLSLRCKIK